MSSLSPVPTNQDDVLNAVVALLVANLAISERYVYQTLAPLKSIGNPPSGDYWVTVSPGDGDFADGQWQAGGGANTLMELATTIVCGYTRIKLDSTDRDDKLLHELKRGVLPVKKKLLKALVGQQLTDTTGNNLLISLIQARHAETPNYDNDKQTGWITLHFATPFQWDMTT